ncbi:unnamed protein product [Adineta steineri]|uniref:RBR-type E3 ubiquitin transferase n=1 Tax=Adineta steineri TaxID=433720 RepID=A0A819Y9M7_9BILA|nr:unnamed protein product [Adineta steineri]CAF1511525.1 unnamed protein product [Adineta steineri]CAF4154670.1 unnamed protein product [Adineta steineri]
MVKPKCLHVAENITNLCAQILADHIYKYPLTLRRLQLRYERKKQEAERYLNEDGDQELAYLAYCNALAYLNMMRQCDEYSQMPESVRTEYEQKQTECEQLECVLRIELEERYNDMASTKEHKIELLSTSSSYKRSPIQSETFKRLLHPSSVRKLPSESSTIYRPVFEESVIPRTVSARLSTLKLSPALTLTPPIRECVVCFSEKPVSDFAELVSSACQHTQRQICNECMRQNTRNAINNSSTTDIRCPEQDCGASLDFHTVRKLVLNLNTVLGRSKAAVDQYENKLSMKYVETMENFLWCAHGCGHGVQLVDNQMVCYRCTHCKEKTCVQHRVRWHTNMTCLEYDEKLKSDQEEQDNQTWLHSHTKTCPGCKVSIEKNEGCDHMTCRHCKHEFCWICLVDYKLIRRHGRHYHNHTCTYYTASRVVVEA